MSYQNANILIQQFVNNYGNTGRSYSVFPFVIQTSTANNKVILDPNTFLRAGGKLRQVRLTYWPILCDTEGDCSTNLCSPGVRVEPKQVMFDITRCFSSKVYSIDKDDIRLLDNNQWDFTNTAKQIIVSALPDLRRGLAIEWETLLYSMAGIHTDGNDEHRITVTNTSTGVVNPIGKLDIEREYLDAGFMSPNILGGQEVYYWKAMVGIGGLNAQGQYINQVDTSNAWYDEGLGDLILNDTANGGHIISIDPQVFKYVYYLENAGIFRTDLLSIEDLGLLYKRGTGDAFIEGTLVDPVTGIAWDLYIKYDVCDHLWTFQFRHRYDFFVMPDIACNIQGVNGIMHWRTCAPVLAPCPTGDAIPSPATAQFFSWTPTLADLPTISQSIIGGFETTQNSPVAITSLADLAAYMNQNSQITFAVNASTIRYSGYTAITATFNNADVTATFA